MADTWIDTASREDIVERIVVRTTFYRSYYNGKMWCESRNPKEVLRMSEGYDCTFEKASVYEFDGDWEEWVPDA